MMPNPAVLMTAAGMIRLFYEAPGRSIYRNWFYTPLFLSDVEYLKFRSLAPFSYSTMQRNWCKWYIFICCSELDSLPLLLPVSVRELVGAEFRFRDVLLAQ